MKGLLFTYAMTYGGAAFSLLSPFHGLLIYVAFAIIKPEKIWHWAVPPGNYSRIVAIAFLGGWILHGLGSWSFGKAKWIVIAFTLFVVWMVLAAANAPNETIAFTAVEEMLKIYLPFIAGLTLITRTEQALQLAWVILISAGYVGFEENLTYFKGDFSETDNLLAHQSAVAAGIGLVLAAQSSGIIRRSVAALASVLLAHTVLIHMSRGAMIGLCAIGAIAFIVLPKSPKLMLFWLTTGSAVLFLAGPSVQREFLSSFVDESSRDYSAQSRFDLWAGMWNAASRNPIFGIGPNHWPLVAHFYGFTKGKEGHGLWPQMLCENGLPGGTAYAAVFLTGLLVPLRVAFSRKRVDGTYAVLAQLCVVPLAGFVTEAWFGSFEGLELPYYIMIVGAAAVKLAHANADGIVPNAVRTEFSTSALAR